MAACRTSWPRHCTPGHSESSRWGDDLPHTGRACRLVEDARHLSVRWSVGRSPPPTCLTALVAPALRLWLVLDWSCLQIQSLVPFEVERFVDLNLQPVSMFDIYQRRIRATSTAASTSSESDRTPQQQLMRARMR